VFVEELVHRAAEQGAVLETVTGPAARAFVIDSIRDAEQSQHHTLGYRVETALWSGQRAGDDGVPAANLLRHGSTSATDLARRYSNGMVEQADIDRDHAQLMVLGSASDDTLSRLAWAKHSARFCCTPPTSVWPPARSANHWRSRRYATRCGTSCSADGWIHS
jgi:hypothetical protein